MIDVEIDDLNDATTCDKCGIVLNIFKALKQHDDPYMDKYRKGRCPLCKNEIEIYVGN